MNPSILIADSASLEYAHIGLFSCSEALGQKVTRQAADSTPSRGCPKYEEKNYFETGLCGTGIIQVLFHRVAQAIQRRKHPISHKAIQRKDTRTQPYPNRSPQTSDRKNIRVPPQDK